MILDQLIEKKELLAYCDLRMRRLVKSKQDELTRVDPKKREQVAHKIDARIAELAHLKNLVHGGNRRIKEETKANWRNLNPDVPESYRLHKAENEIMGLEDALIVKKVEVVGLSQRIAALEEALRAVIEGNDLAAERGHSIESWPGSSVRKEARAVLEGDAPGGGEAR